MREKKIKTASKKKKNRVTCDKFIFFSSHDCKECVREKINFFFSLLFLTLLFFSFLW